MRTAQGCNASRTRAGTGSFGRLILPRPWLPGEHPQGREHFWFIVRPIEEVEEGSDRWAMQHGYVSMTPLRLDLTSEDALAKARRRHPVD